MTQLPKKVVIIGGGITGLSAAFYMQKLAAEKQVPLELTLVEKNSQLGGKISTLRKDGFIIERAPDSFLSRKTPILDLTSELGLEDELVPTNQKAKKTYILNKGKLHPMPAGLVLGIPTEITPFATTGLLSPLGKVRAGMDLILPKRRENTDESLGHFLERRLGKEVLENIAEPLLAGIYAGNTRKLSLQATFPQFHLLEKKYRSMILGMMASKKNTAQDPTLPDIAKKSMFLSYRNGLQTLVEALEQALHTATLLTGQGVMQMDASDQQQKKVVLEDGTKLAADMIILATPSYITQQLLSKLSTSSLLAETAYVSVANVIMAFELADVEHVLDGSGFLVPRSEGRSITACTWTSSKWMHTAPEGKILLRCYIGRSGEEDWVNESDEQLLQRARKDLAVLIDLQATPLFYEVNRWPESMPQYGVGHLERLSKVREDLQQNMPGIFIAGSAFQGVGLPDCIRQGKEAAEQVITHLY